MAPGAEAAYASAVTGALAEFPLTVRSVALLHVSENLTWRVTDASGQRYVLRLHRPGYHTLDELVSERCWIRALSEAGIRVPQSILTRAGEEYATVRVAATGEVRHAGLAHWTDGEVLEGLLTTRSPALDDPQAFDHWFVQLGALIADLHNQASTWTPPRAFKRHSLDANGLMGEQPFWGRFWEHPSLAVADRALLAQARSRLHRELSALGRTADTYSVIHADLHPGNLLVNGSTLAVIDFDDAGFGWHLYDLAVALRPHQHRPHFERIADAVLLGYRSRRPLTDESTRLIPLFMLIRRLASIGWLMQRPELGADLEREDLALLCRDVQTFLAG
jgi:Ser/Thr protein kinase RdoA (MazF antagonist)